MGSRLKYIFRRGFNLPQSIIFLVCVLLLVPAPAPCHEVLVLGIHPYQPDNVLRESFTPLADYLQDAMGNSVEIRIGTNYEDHIHAISTGAMDLAFLGPAGYVNLTRLYGEFPLLGKIVTNGGPVFRESVDQVRQALDDLRDEIRERFPALRGSATEVESFDCMELFEELRRRLSTLGMAERSGEVDEFGMDEVVLERARPLLDWLLDHYWRVVELPACPA